MYAVKHLSLDMVGALVYIRDKHPETDICVCPNAGEGFAIVVADFISCSWPQFPHKARLVYLRPIWGYLLPEDRPSGSTGGLQRQESSHKSLWL